VLTQDLGKDETTGAANWPRDGELLKGIVHQVKGEKWLECKEVKQKTESKIRMGSLFPRVLDIDL